MDESWASGPVVAGVDPTTGSWDVVVRAAAEARARRTGLVLVSVRDPTVATSTVARTLACAARLAAGTVGAHAVVEATYHLTAPPSGPLTAPRRHREVARAVVGLVRSTQAGLLVLGRRAGVVPAPGAATSCLPHEVVRWTPVPLLLVPTTVPDASSLSARPAGPPRGSGTLLGHDGSLGARAAVEVAVAQARSHDEPLVLVRSYRSVLGPEPGGELLTGERRRELGRREAGWYLHDLCAVAADVRRRHPGLEVRCRLAESPGAFTTITAFADGARLTVLGRGGYWAGPGEPGRDLVAVLRWSHAPVLIVPPGTAVAGPATASPHHRSWWS